MALLGADNAANARKLSAWKRKIRGRWPGVSIALAAIPAQRIGHRESITLCLRAQLNGLQPDDVIVECLLGKIPAHGKFTPVDRRLFNVASQDGDSAEFSLELTTEQSGLLHYQLRIYPHHPLLTHPFEMGCMLWV
jgi:starch phosphorylase